MRITKKRCWRFASVRMLNNPNNPNEPNKASRRKHSNLPNLSNHANHPLGWPFVLLCLILALLAETEYWRGQWRCPLPQALKRRSDQSLPLWDSAAEKLQVAPVCTYSECACTRVYGRVCHAIERCEMWCFAGNR